MLAHAAVFTRLALLVQRLVDAEMLSESEGASLLAETEAARQALEAGDTEAVRQHIAQIAHFTEALVQTDLLALSDGWAVIQVAEDILNPQTDRDI